MKNPESFPNTVGIWPAVVSKNASSPSAGDGTPFSTDFIDDLWGSSQALMDYADLSPDGSSESATSSQRLEAMKRAFGAPGEVVMWGSDADPATLGLRLLMLEGGTVLCADYQELVTNTWCGAASNATNHSLGGGFVKTSDIAGTVASDTGVYFKLPDSRGMVPRGLDGGAGHDPDDAYRVIGNRQMDMVLLHEHAVKAYTAPATFYSYNRLANSALNGTGDKDGLISNGGSGTLKADLNVTSTGMENSDYHVAYATAFQGVETRMKNFAIRFAVRY